MSKKSLLSALVAILIGGLLLASAMRFGAVQAATEVTGIISSDTTWTKANSPYSLTGPTAVGEGVILTIEPGVTVKLNNYNYIQVNGTLVARGSDSDKIHFNGGSIKFTAVSNGWNEQTGKGSIIENAIIDCYEIRIKDVSPKISYNTIYCHIEINGDSSAWYSGRSDSDSSPCSPIISNNNIISGSKTTPHTIYSNHQCAPIIVNNTITNMRVACINAVISNNVMKGEGIVASNSCIYNNVLSDCPESGISAGSKSNVFCNMISGCSRGIRTTNRNVFIQNNTVVNNRVGIYVDGPDSALNYVHYNNIHDNSEYNVRLSIYATGDYNLKNNWWGTTDKQVISQKIYDNKNDFNLGKVNFEPFLIAPNPEAPDASYTPSLSPSPTTTPEQEPSPTPSQEPQQLEQEILVGVAITVAVIAAGLGLLIYLIKRK